MNIKDLVGTFSIIGSNQDDSENSYKGTLNLSLDDDNRIIAKWMINNTQEQFGTGFYKNNILVIASHSRDMIRKTCNRVLWMEHGKVRMDGPVQEVTDAYFKK